MSATTSTANRWSKPAKATGADHAFGGDMNVLLPLYSEIPDEFKGYSRNTWADFQRDWFFNGLKDASAKPHDGVDPATAFRHLKAIQASWEPKHEHKEAGVAYLASLWFVSVSANGKTYGNAGSGATS